MNEPQSRTITFGLTKGNWNPNITLEPSGLRATAFLRPRQHRWAITLSFHLRGIFNRPSVVIYHAAKGQAFFVIIDGQ